VRGTVRCGDVGSQNLLNKLQACRCVQQGHFRRGYERKTVANWPDDLAVFRGLGRVFCNPYVTQRLNAFSQKSTKSLIYMVPPHGIELHLQSVRYKVINTQITITCV